VEVRIARIRQTGQAAVLLAAGLAATLLATPPAVAQVAQTPKPRTVLAALSERVPETSFQDVPLDMAIAWVADTAGINIAVRWADLEARGVERDKPVSIKSRNIRIYQVLQMILREAGGADVPLGFRIENDLLTISTADQVDIEMVVKAYDVSDLLVRVRRFTPPTVDLAAVGQGQRTGVLTNPNEGRTPDEVPADDPSGLIRLITRVVEPDTWSVNGGRGTIEAFGSQIVVWNTVTVHQRLGGPVAGVHVETAR